MGVCRIALCVDMNKIKLLEFFFEFGTTNIWQIYYHGYFNTDINRTVNSQSYKMNFD